VWRPAFGNGHAGDRKELVHPVAGQQFRTIERIG
jgi:hypothetical protein